MISVSDNYTSADFVSFVDTDVLFMTVVTYESMFDEAGRLRMRGYAAAQSAIID